jgi:8-hydroxy-5-deazaflavin:NADPH oxidoreductase
MKVGVLGSGDVARTLAAGFLKHGHAVLMGSRTPEKLVQWASLHPGLSTGTFGEAARFGDLIVLAVKGTAAEEALQLAGETDLAGKTVIDATNPIAEAPPVNGVISFFTTLDHSLMERLQQTFPDTHLVKAFSCVGHAFMVNPRFEAGPPTMFICGNDDQAKQVGAWGSRSVRLGNGRHGQGGGVPGDRAALHALVHSRLPAQRVGACLQAAHLKRWRGAGAGKSAWNADWRLSAGSAALFQRVSK